MTEAYAYDELESDLTVMAGAGSGIGRLQKAALREGVHGYMDEARLALIGADVVREWNADKDSNKEWREKAEAALDSAAQEGVEPKNYPFKGASNVKYPLLTIASTGFNARALPAIVRGDEAIYIKTFGKNRKSKKQQRADRVAAYLNFRLFYRVKDWVHDTDAMLIRLPAVGQHYRKVWWDPVEGRECIESVSALRLTLAAGATSMATSPRITHDYDRYPHQLQRLMRSGHFREIDITPEGDDEQAPRVILEQYRYIDLDGDDIDEPYIVTVDAATSEVLRIDEGWEDDGIEEDESGVVKIERWLPFVDYGFIPDPKGRAYAIGFGHLLTPIMAVIDTIINQSIDAGHAQVAGGGFVSQEVRMQGAGQNGNLRFQPGEYKTVNASAQDLRNAIYERTFPGPSAVLFELLGMLMEAAERIASVNDAMTGDANRNAPVGTTLALIEQGQQVFNAIYKRIFEGLRQEFTLYADVVGKYGDPQDYADFCDEYMEPEQPSQMGHNGGPPMDAAAPPNSGQPAPPMAPQMPAEAPPMGLLGMSAPGMAPPVQGPPDPEQMFREDFNFKDLDIRPISDPSAVTRAQLLAKFQVALQFVGKGVYVDDNVVIRYGLIAAGINEAEDWIPERDGPSPQEVLMQKLQQAIAEAEVAIKQGQAAQYAANAQKLQASTQTDAAKTQADVGLKQAQTAAIVDELQGQQALERAQTVQSELANDEVQRRQGLADAAMTLMGPAIAGEQADRDAEKQKETAE